MMMRRTIGLSLALLVAAAPAIAKQAQPGHNHHLPSVKSKSGATAAAAGRSHEKRQRTNGKLAMRAKSRQRGQIARNAAPLPPLDQYIGPLHVIGTREVGHAAWYGGRHIGRRTASGERLDAVHPTAAHRSLPLHSLVRVTNLRNGRSVVATITDRGPVSRSLLIDVSPRAAQELDMVHSGIATVAIEPVAAVSSEP
jgi:rare lipoprotein A